MRTSLQVAINHAIDTVLAGHADQLPHGAVRIWIEAEHSVEIIIRPGREHGD